MARMYPYWFINLSLHTTSKAPECDNYEGVMYTSMHQLKMFPKSWFFFLTLKILSYQWYCNITAILQFNQQLLLSLLWYGYITETNYFKRCLFNQWNTKCLQNKKKYFWKKVLVAVYNKIFWTICSRLEVRKYWEMGTAGDIGNLQRAAKRRYQML